MARCSRVPSLRTLCTQCLEKNVEPENSIMNANQRLVLYEQLLYGKKLSEKVLRILSTCGGPSQHFLNRYNEANFSGQPINDSCISLIFHMLPNAVEMNQPNFRMKLDLSSCIELSNPTLDVDNRDKLPILALSLAGCKYLENATFVIQMCCSATLKYIDLTDCRCISSTQIGDIGDYFRELASITLNGCTQLQDYDLIRILENNLSLESISVWGCNKISNKTIDSICESKLQLKKLLLGQTRKITTSSILRFLAQGGRSLQRIRLPSHCMNPWLFVSLPYMCPNIKSLNLQYVDMRWLILLRYPTEAQLNKITKEPQDDDCEDYLIWKRKMNKIFTGLTIEEQNRAGERYLSAIEDIALDSVQWDNSVAEEIFPFCRSLYRLSLHGCRTPDSHTFESIVRSGCTVTSLDFGYMISSCSASEGIGRLNCSNLRSLSAHSSFRDDIVSCWLNQNPLACKKLSQISIHWSDNARDTGVSQLLQRCGPSLEFLSAGLCYFLTGVTFESLASYCPNVTELDLCSIPSITDDIVDFICLGCPLLEKLNLAHNSEITDVGIESIATRLPKLNTLKLDNLLKISDKGVYILAVFITSRLKVLSIAGIRALTDKSLQILGKYCASSLIHLNIASTRFTAPGIAKLLSLVSFLKVLNVSMHPHVDDSVVQAATKIRFLRVLDLSECPLITNHCIPLLASCSTLEDLSLGNSIRISDSLLPILNANDGHITITTPSNASVSRW